MSGDGADVVKLQNLDISIFGVPSQSTDADKRTLLLLQNIARSVQHEYVYLEIGSHLGGSLLPHLLDPRCRFACSVDKRPTRQPDERGVVFDYTSENTAQRMIATLEPHVAPASLLKLATFDADVSELETRQLPLKADLAFIDGEHTNVAVFRDFVSTLRFLNESFVVAFHDAQLLCDGLQNIETFLHHQAIEFRSFFLPDLVFAIATGRFLDLAGHALDRMSLNRHEFIRQSRLSLWHTIAGNAGRFDTAFAA